MGTLYIISVRIIKRKTLVEFYSAHKETKSQLEAWYYEVKNSNWNNPAEVKKKYGSASIVGNKVVFNIKGNKFRLVTEINYQMKIVFIRFIGTHNEYNRINVEEL